MSEGPVGHDTGPRTVPGVLEALRSIRNAAAGSGNGESGGIASFTYLYEQITADVLAKLRTPGWFEDDHYLACLDVEFAKRYLEAVSAWSEAPHQVPRSWRVLFERQDESRITPLQFAVAGVNAHVNFDLPFALVSTCQALGASFGAGTQHGDYQKINEIFAQQMGALRHHFEDSALRVLDRSALSRINDLADDIAVVVCRDVAWHHGEGLWVLRDDPAAFERRRDALDIEVALASAALLTPL